jgi:hypothetical protein
MTGRPVWRPKLWDFRSRALSASSQWRSKEVSSPLSPLFCGIFKNCGVWLAEELVAKVLQDLGERPGE